MLRRCLGCVRTVYRSVHLGDTRCASVARRRTGGTWGKVERRCQNGDWIGLVVAYALRLLRPHLLSCFGQASNDGLVQGAFFAIYAPWTYPAFRFIESLCRSSTACTYILPSAPCSV